MTLHTTLAENEIKTALRTNITDPILRGNNNAWIKVGTMTTRARTPAIYLHRIAGTRKWKEIGSYNKEIDMMLTIECHVAKGDRGIVESTEYEGKLLCSALIDHIENVMLTNVKTGTYFKIATPVTTSEIREWDMEWTGKSQKRYSQKMYSGLLTYEVQILNWD